jgi:hypothetical protein
VRESYLTSTDTFDFDKPNVKEWMNEHKMWKGENEDTLDFVHRVYKELRLHLPYNMEGGGAWVCSQMVTEVGIQKPGNGECCRHAVVGTSILRANKVPARTVCGLWAIDEKSKAAHCWGEFFLEGVGWVPYDTTLGGDKLESEAHFGIKKGEVLAGMIDFNWVIDAGSFDTHTVFAIDAFPAFWSEGGGNPGRLEMRHDHPRSGPQEIPLRAKVSGRLAFDYWIGPIAPAPRLVPHRQPLSSDIDVLCQVGSSRWIRCQLPCSRPGFLLAPV